MHDMLPNCKASCQLDCGAQDRRHFQNAVTMAWETRATKLGSEERFRRISLWWHRKSLNSIYSGVSARGKKAQPMGFGFAVSCPLWGRPPVTGMWKSGKPDPFQDSLLQTCYLLSSRSQICPDLRGKMGSYSTSPNLLKYFSLYLHRHTAQMCHFYGFERKHWKQPVFEVELFC